MPNIVVAVFSFNKPKGKFNYSFNEFSTAAWTNPCGTRASASRSGSACRSASSRRLIGATVLGTMIAFALGRYRFRGRSATNLLIFMPMATPEVVMGSSLLTLFLAHGHPVGAHGRSSSRTSCSACRFVVVAVKARVATLDPRLEEAAADLVRQPDCRPSCG